MPPEQMSPPRGLCADRQTEGGFPELKVLKQRLRNHIQPDMSLGHSDKPGTQVLQQA